MQKLKIKTSSGTYSVYFYFTMQTGLIPINKSKPVLSGYFSDGNWSIYDDWNEWINFPDMPANKDAETLKNKVCLHDWKEYTGFTDKYWYCEKCDAKSEENPNRCF